MKVSFIYNALRIFIAFVWFVNGLFCKVLNLIPRHEQIVAQILGSEHSRLLTILIGISEIVMAIWILSKYRAKANASLQICVILLMNLLEFLLVPDLLLWGRLNSMFAVLFGVLIFVNEFMLSKKLVNQKR